MYCSNNRTIRQSLQYKKQGFSKVELTSVILLYPMAERRGAMLLVCRWRRGHLKIQEVRVGVLRLLTTSASQVLTAAILSRLPRLPVIQELAITRPG